MEEESAPCVSLSLSFLDPHVIFPLPSSHLTSSLNCWFKIGQTQSWAVNFQTATSNKSPSLLSSSS